MKKFFQICSILLTAILLFSCANQTTEYGTLTLQLPSGNASRAAVNVDALSFNIEITNQETKESQKETGTAGSVHSIELPTGKYTIKLDAFTAENKENPFYTGSVTDVEVTPGDTVKVALTLHEVQTAPVVFSVKAGTVKYGTKVELSSTTKNAKIYYTTDGSDPLTSSTKTEYKEPVTISKSMTIKAYAVSDSTIESDVTAAAYMAEVKVETALIKPEEITKAGLLSLLMKVEDEGSTLTATVDASAIKNIKSYTWVINGVVAENETTYGEITSTDPVTGEESVSWGSISIIGIDGNSIYLDKTKISSDIDIKTKYNITLGFNSFITCIVETEDGYTDDITYKLFLGI